MPRLASAVGLTAGVLLALAGCSEPAPSSREDAPGADPALETAPAFTAPAGEEAGLLVPEEAVVRHGERKLVYVVDYEGNVERRYIRAGTPTADGAIPVLSGLHQPEQVALDPMAAAIVYERQRDSARP